MLPATLLSLLSLALAAPLANNAPNSSAPWAALSKRYYRPGTDDRPLAVRQVDTAPMSSLTGGAARRTKAPAPGRSTSSLSSGPTSISITPTAPPPPPPPTTTPTPGVNAGLAGPGYWNLKTTFYSLASFQQSISWKSFTFGSSSVQVVQGVPRSAWAASARESNNASALQIAYPQGSLSPGHSPQGGVGFYSSPLDITNANNVSLAYSVFFPADFDFVKGGKLPGLYGGRTGCSGGQSAEDCFSTRIMWRTGGAGELYLYAPREKQVDALCTLGPLSYCNSVNGMSIGRGSWTFRRGQWNDVRQDVWLNTPGKADGGFNIWVNNKLVLHSSSVYYRNSVTSTKAVVAGQAAAPMPLIDYDNLPEGTVIPNGGLRAADTSASSNATSDWETRRRRAVVDLARGSYENRQTFAQPIGLRGIMFHTFFGGSTASWASPRLQYSYINQVALRIRS